MLLSWPPLKNPLFYSNSSSPILPFFSYNALKLHNSFIRLKPLTFTSASSSFNTSSISNPSLLRHVNHTVCDDDDDDDDGSMVPSASAVASVILRASTSPVEFVHRIENRQTTGLVLPSPDFQRLCVEQLDLFRRIVDPEALLSVYVRPAGSFVMDRLELRRVVSFPGVNVTDVVILVGNFSVPTGLRAAEATFSSQQVEVIPEHKAIVFPMVKHPFVVGFLVAELPNLEMDMQSAECDPWPYSSPHEAGALLAGFGTNTQGIQSTTNGSLRTYKLNADRQANAFHISRSLAMAYVMDQKAMLLQQSSWQNNLRMTNLVDQIRGSLSSIQTLSKMLSVHMKKNEIAYEILEDILVQGNHMRDTLQQLQDAVYLTKANIVHYNEETLKKMYKSSNPLSESVKNQLDNYPTDASSSRTQGGLVSSKNMIEDLEMPMPPTVLAPVQRQGIRSCNVSDVLNDLVEAVKPLASKQQRIVELSEQVCSMQIAVEESSLRQALSNLIEGALLRTRVGGKVEIVSTTAPAGGALIFIDDDGPDMHYMTQMHSLTAFGADLLSKERVEDNMTWNFVAGLTVACEILESYGCVVRVISPRCSDAALGSGGTRLELWLPSTPGTSLHNLDIPTSGA
ncbi:chloroplast sensor kinase, chloroplastic isoform X1 [Cucurbita pepo subsp. pepo]|uniref:chloroplast sensor kinase, chloroplastic isoform X1 n=1 Tax=Cucurbita pepo subsp. pepo TaxID=3664 RepID=UPI000C9D5826|nr:chloroplast sensor kinase, chloroplastic isoform X1 [Cucurbita pepo subsp. pepo]